MTQFNEPYRPQLHYTPKIGWMNDPNGLVYFNGEYHLFYQYYPKDTVWGPMHWGHAISKDMINWEELPIALFPDEQGMCFSGSAIVDWNNASGLFEDGKPGLLAYYTAFVQSKKTVAGNPPEEIDTGAQHQALAYSQDGKTWKKYNGGEPIIYSRGNPDFRDPKVIWHEESKTWVMVISCGQHIEFFSSTDLINWELVSEFGYHDGTHSKGPWECPDLFKLPVEGTDESRWVLVVGIGEGAHCAGAGTQYFIGDFDGKVFTNENRPQKTLWLDYGRDYYALQSWSDIPEQDGRRIGVAWMSNHQYSLELPTNEFRSNMSLPREFFLYSTEEGARLGQRFVKELNDSLPVTSVEADLTSLGLGDELTLGNDSSVQLIDFKLSLTNHSKVTVHISDECKADLLVEKNDDGLTITTVRKGQFDKQRINAFYPHKYSMPAMDAESVELQILLDNCSQEVLVNGGKLSISNLMFVGDAKIQPKLKVEQGHVTVHGLTSKQP